MFHCKSEPNKWCSLAQLIFFIIKQSFKFRVSGSIMVMAIPLIMMMFGCLLFLEVMIIANKRNHLFMKAMNRDILEMSVLHLFKPVIDDLYYVQSCDGVSVHPMMVVLENDSNFLSVYTCGDPKQIRTIEKGPVSAL